ncbi:Uncharacterised protein [Helicobacter fennelliae]|uniref:Uncharacterized protein n=1 Tax=Helicobacter fennelliae TaxID=215 RepID=A0A2X3GHS5_9HELI|nr:hypothetical protein [Helicobacter fennelliae]SQC36499.1 Uncharacterised protein [Helicobacter fennelliae]
METMASNQKLNDEIYISIKRYCELRNISESTFWRMKKADKFHYKIVKLKGYGKKHFLLIKKEQIVYINKQGNVLL